MFIRNPAAFAMAIWFCRMRRKSWLYGSEWKYRLAGATAYRRSHGSTVIASRSGMLTHSSSCGPSSPIPSSAPTVYNSDPAAASARCSTGTHLDFGTPCTSVYAPNTYRTPFATRSRFSSSMLATLSPRCRPAADLASLPADRPCPCPPLSADRLIAEQLPVADPDQHAAQHPFA